MSDFLILQIMVGVLLFGSIRTIRDILKWQDDTKEQLDNIEQKVKGLHNFMLTQQDKLISERYPSESLKE